MRPSFGTPRSSRRKTDTAKPFPLNEELWSCTVAMIVEKSSDYKKYVKAFEEGSKNGSRPVIKHVGAKDVEASASGGMSTVRPFRVVKPETVATLGQAATTVENNKAEQIAKTILRLKADDLYKMNRRNSALERCSGTRLGRKEILEEGEPSSGERVAVHDEPLCGPSLYIVLTGFYEPDLVFRLLRLKVPLELVLAFDDNRAVRNTDGVLRPGSVRDKAAAFKKPKIDPHEYFWKGYDEYIKDRANVELTSNTIVVNCDPKECLEGKENLKAKELNELTYDYVCAKLYSVQNERRRYVDFVRNVKESLLDAVPRLTTRQMKRYYDSVRAVPLDITRADHVLNCIVEQIEYDEETGPNGGKVEEAQKHLQSTAADDGSESETSTEKANRFSGGDEITSSLESDAIVTALDLTPFVIEYGYRRKFDLKNRQLQFDKWRDNYCKILEGLICPRLWRFFPRVSREEKLFTRSHIGKINRYFKFGDNPILEACFLKRIFNRMVLSTVDARNVDPKCEEVFDAFCGCCPNPESSLSSAERKKKDGYGQEEEEVVEEASQHGEWRVRSFYTGQGSVRIRHPFTPRATMQANSVETQIKQVPTLDRLITKNQLELNLLKCFLTYPELDTLFNQSYDALENYNVFETYSKETCLSLLNTYSCLYDLIDYVYYGPTDSILFVFHRNTDDMDLVQKSFGGYLLTAMGFRDYYNTLTKTYPYLPWIRNRGETIERENQDLIKKFKVILNGEQEEKCCFQKIKKYGIFPAEESRQHEEYSSHVPHPRAMTSEGNRYSFIGYRMDTSCHVRCHEDSTSYVSKRGVRISRKSYDLFDPLKTANHVSLTHKSCSVLYNMPTNLWEYEATDSTEQKVVVETDDVRFTYTYVNGGVVPEAGPSKRASGKDGSAHRRKFGSDTVEVVKPEYKRKSDCHRNDLDAKITLPNGLEVTVYRLNGQISGVKQRHLDKRWRDELGEKYRVYLKDGTVMAFKEDDTVSVYYSNSTFTQIKRVSKEKRFDSFCGKESSARTKFLSNDAPDEYTSEKNLEKQSYYVIGEHQVVSWSGTVKRYRFGFPWETESKYRLRTAYQPGAELFTLRTDGTKSVLKHDGQLIVQYPDGTKITSTPRHESIFVSRSDADDPDGEDENDDWVYVTLDILVEKPAHYLPVRCFNDSWTITLDGNKRFSFDRLGSTMFSTPESELRSDLERRLIRFRAFYSDTTVVGDYTIGFGPEEDGTVCKFSEENDTLTVDVRGKVTLLKNRVSDETCSSESNRIFPRFDSGLTLVGASSIGEESLASYESSDGGSFYVVKPTASQTVFKLVCLNRDLTGCQLVEDTENEGFDCGVNMTRGRGELRHDLNRSDDAARTVTVWNLLPDAQTFPTATVAYRAGYTDPRSFASSELRRNVLSGYLSRSTVWLFETSQEWTRRQASDMLDDRRRGRTPRNQSEGRERCFPDRNGVVTMYRQLVDLDRWDGYDTCLQRALRLYLEYKKRVYTALLTNSVHQIDTGLPDLQELQTGSPFAFSPFR